MYNRRRRGRGPQAVRREEHAWQRRVWALSTLLFGAAILVLLGTSLPIGQLASSSPVSETLPAADAAPPLVGEPFPSAPTEPPPPPPSVPTPPSPGLVTSTPPPADPAAVPPPPTASAPTAQPAATPTAAMATGGPAAPTATSQSQPTATPQPTALASQLAPSPSPSPAPVQSPVAGCQVGESFTRLADALGEATIGHCLENEYVNLTTGDTHQRTTRGLLVWVKARGVSAFTDGRTTWYACADEIRERPTGQPFPC